ncbi:MAG: Rne/Rng family ribonuclease, partial [Pseudomonadota bacterium]
AFGDGRRMRTYKIQEVIKRRQIVLVQVVKEERGTKGAALTTYLSLAGRYTVLMPNTARGGGISRKITNSADRKRLKAIAEELDVPEGMGLIIRTAGASRTKQEIKRDFEYLLRLWESVRDLTLESSAPTLVYEEGNLIKRSIRDLYSKDTDEIVVAGEEAYREAKDFMRMLMPSHAKNVVRFSDPGSLFSKFRIESQLGAMFSPIVTLPSGGYLVINQTEALVAIDINSGRATREFSIEETALKTNLEAAEEIARQLKLRDLAGLIVIDFIDMDEKRNNRSVERRVKDCLKLDRARIQVGRISHFGLLEMSRQRLRTGVLEGSTTQCPHCQGTGIVRSIPSVALAVLRGIEDALERGAGSLKVQCAPEVAFYLLNEKRQFLNELEDQFECRIMVNGSDAEQGASFSIDSENDMASRPEPQRSRRRDAVSMGRGNEAEDEATASTDEDDEERRPRRRRRRRGGRGRDSGAEDDANGLMAADDGDDDGESDVGEEAVADGDADGDQPSRGRRSRKRGRRGGQRNRGQSANGADLDVSAPDAPQPDIAGSDFSGEGEEDDGDGDTSYAAQAGTIVSAANAIRRRSGNEGRRSNGDGRGRGRGRRGARANAESDQQAANASDDAPLENGAAQADDGNPDGVGSPEQTNAQSNVPATSSNGAAETHEVEASASVNGANGSTATKAANGEASVADEPAKTADADADTETAEAAPPPKPRAHWGEPKVSAPTIETVTLAPETPDAEVPPVETDKPQRRGWWQRNFG